DTAEPPPLGGLGPPDLRGPWTMKGARGEGGDAMKRLVLLAVLSGGLVAPAVAGEPGPDPRAGDPSKADRPPRKVVVGTVIFGPYGAYPGLDERLKVLGGLIDAMARQAAERYPGHGLDLAI